MAGRQLTVGFLFAGRLVWAIGFLASRKIRALGNRRARVDVGRIYDIKTARSDCDKTREI